MSIPTHLDLQNMVHWDRAEKKARYDWHGEYVFMYSMLIVSSHFHQVSALKTPRCHISGQKCRAFFLFSAISLHVHTWGGTYPDASGFLLLAFGPVQV